MMHQLQDAAQRGAQIITFNPLRERGLERFDRSSITFSDVDRLVHQDKYAVSSGEGRWRYRRHHGNRTKLLLLRTMNAARGRRPLSLIINSLPNTFTVFRNSLKRMPRLLLATAGASIGLSRAAIEVATTAYARADRTIGIYGMGLTQHRAGVEAVQMLVNLLLLRGNIGKPGAGICPVRGHSNVQGQRTVGITEKPELVPLDRLAEQFRFAPPREKGMNTVESCEGIIHGKVSAFLMLGGNFVRAIPEREKMEAAWSKLRLTVSIS